MSASSPRATVDFQNLFGREGPVPDSCTATCSEGKFAEGLFFRQPRLTQAFEIHFGKIEPRAMPFDGDLGV